MRTPTARLAGPGVSRLAGPGVAMALVVALAGCGGSGEPTGMPATGASPPVVPPTPAVDGPGADGTTNNGGGDDGDDRGDPADGPEPTATPSPAEPPSGEESGGRESDDDRRSLRARIRALPVSGETGAGYDRDRFEHWVDADDDCRDTRDEVLAAESEIDVSACDVGTGRWTSYYDGRRHTRASELHIDHVVALAEAWDSGARRWSPGTRGRFANDLGDDRALAAVTGSVNQAKSDDDPAEWLPPEGRCRYVQAWVAVKTRWRLTVDRAERRVLLDLAQRCPDTTVRVERARVETAPPPAGSDGDGGPDAGGAGGYRYPPPPPDLDCGGVEARDFRVRPGDPHRFDGDGDGIGCES